MQINQFFKGLGLSENAGKIYFAILGAGNLTVSAIAKKANLHRYIVYNHLTELINKGLIVKSTRGQRTFFAAESPDKLENLYKEFIDGFGECLETLKSRYIVDTIQPGIKFFEGKDAIKNILIDIAESLEKGETYYRYSSEKNLQKSLDYTPDKYYKLRDLKQLQRFVIGNKPAETTRDNKLDRIVKVVPKRSGLFDDDIVEVIYGNKVAYLDYMTDTATVIEDNRIADFQKKVFKLLYDRL